MSPSSKCIICKLPIFKGIYCSDCQNEMERARTMDEFTIEEWVEKRRVKVPEEHSSESTIDEFFQIV
ncbi:MAG: nucleotide-binding protein [Thermoplasmataceae archaeon]